MTDDTDDSPDVPWYVQEIADDENKTDVTEQFDEAIEMFATLSQNRTTPVPLDHVIAYTEDDTDADEVIVRFTVDTNDELFDNHFGFEIEADREVLASFADDETDHEEADLILDQYSRLLRSAKEAIWQEVVNV